MFRRILSLSAAAMVAIALVACGDAEAEEPTATVGPEVRTIEGNIVVHPIAERVELGAPCESGRGLDDLTAGMEVRLRADGQLLDVGRLEQGSAVRTGDTVVVLACEFAFALAVPEGYDFYTVEAGKRGEFNYRWEEIITPGALHYSIGD